ncbi:MAG: sn-glycerol-3-phosphate ABC transporter ATP-binding protein UgpC [Candidatus Marinimicrobia bacterium]|jgi:multiple sugar transport system ATP-binding protein|nr:sn-glycerol-3-phosphate ABC transporter ATP-binding protein UgpC [Candidatus Neomarinimicrobiota bacterium]|tara:strand:+ start:1974 stop:3086 length:1113 start_codon:yes stop_codon:yes gene_type:complete
MAKITLKNIQKVFDKNIIAVNDFSMEIKNKEMVVLLGPSGCGKSTLLRMIAGLIDITEGELFIGDNLVNDVSPKDRDIAMVFQNYALYPHMSVFQNISFGLELRNYNKDDIQKKVDRAAKILNIEELLDRKPKELSGGQQQRVALGRAIVRDPKVFLFDEPLSNLDSKLRIQMRSEISKLHENLQATMIYVTHDQIEAMTMGDRIVVMKDGVIQQIDTPLNLYNSPKNKFVAGFIGNPSMNLMQGQVINKGGLLFDNGSFSFQLPQDFEKYLKLFKGYAITFGIRPEDIHIQEKSLDIKKGCPVSLEVELVEPIGNESFIHITTGLNNLIARVHPQTQLQIGQKVDLVFDMSKAHFFNTDTGGVISVVNA